MLDFITQTGRRLAGAAVMAAGLTFAVLPFNAATAQAPAGAPDSFADLVETLQPSVVNISSKQKVSEEATGDYEELFRRFMERRRGGNRPAPSSLGSGFIISEDGLVVTNNHVIEDADEITVTLADDTDFKAEIIGRDERTDLAVLQLQDLDGRRLPSTSWGNSDELRIGDWLIAIGNPFGFGGTVTAGIVSALQREVGGDPYDSFIQTDAAINRGNSGGPSFNVKGEVIGVNTAIISPSGGSVGIGFAIPSTLAQAIVGQLIEHGEVKRGWLGVRIQEVTEDLAEGLGLPDTDGVLIASLTSDGPAERAGIESGDVIVQFSGQDVPGTRELQLMVAGTAIGEVVDVVVWRDRAEKTISVKLGNLADLPAVIASRGDGSVGKPEKMLADLGLALKELENGEGETAGLKEDETGVKVAAVEPGSTFAEKDVRPGDIIVEVDQTAVASADDVSRIIEAARADNFSVATLLVFREGDYRWIAVKIAK